MFNLKKLVSHVLLGGLVVSMASGMSSKADFNPYLEIYRLFNPANGDHIYTCAEYEAQDLIAEGWESENSPGWSTDPDGVEIFMLTNESSGEHLFTADKREKNTLAKNGWRVDNDGFPVFYGVDESGKPMYRLFNPNAANAISSHHYTQDKNEIKQLKKQGWLEDNNGKPVFYLIPKEAVRDTSSEVYYGAITAAGVSERGYFYTIQPQIYVTPDDKDLIKQYGLPKDLDGYDFEIVDAGEPQNLVPASDCTYRLLDWDSDEWYKGKEVSADEFWAFLDEFLGDSGLPIEYKLDNSGRIISIEESYLG